MDDVEEERLRILDRVLEERDVGIEELERRYRPGTHGCHEALHVASLLEQSVSARLCEHPAVLLNPDWYRLCVVARRSLSDLYTAIAERHVDRDDGYADWR